MSKFYNGYIVNMYNKGVGINHNDDIISHYLKKIRYLKQKSNKKYVLPLTLNEENSDNVFMSKVSGFS